MVNHLTEEYVSVYVPTTPNPTSGFFLMLPKSEVIELDMSVDAALKYIVSMGSWRRRRRFRCPPAVPSSRRCKPRIIARAARCGAR